MSYTTEVVVVIEVDGMHRWPDAPQDGISADTKALCHPHRHRFEIRVSAEVTRNDRQIEFFALRRRVQCAMASLYDMDGFGLVEFGARSCEMIACDLLDSLALCNWCAVYEDGENGAEVSRG